MDNGKEGKRSGKEEGFSTLLVMESFLLGDLENDYGYAKGMWRTSQINWLQEINIKAGCTMVA